MRRIALALCIVGLALGTTACPEKGPAQKAGEAIDETVEDIKDAGKGTMEKAGEKVDEAVEETK